MDASTAAGLEAGGADDGGMTLAFTLDAVAALADPGAVFADARRWSTHVGIVADDADAVSDAVERHGLRQDYELDALDAQSVLSRLKWEADTDRYVLVGTAAADADLAAYVNWEYLDVADAAEKAGWRLQSDLTRLERLWMRVLPRRIRP